MEAGEAWLQPHGPDVSDPQTLNSVFGLLYLQRAIGFSITFGLGMILSFLVRNSGSISHPAVQ